ncbi:DUF1266 domain-containing protein [Streptomyces sp. NPDC059637]|uniref:DUF1266 domain-containing protein n=1 Tax=Streptomyces sp. NPDC059637 TaxID=3347752 RepID=UPI003695962C
MFGPGHRQWTPSSPPLADFLPPGPLEARLAEAARARSDEPYLQLLAGRRLFVQVPHGRTDHGRTDGEDRPPGPDLLHTRGTDRALPLWTRGTLPPAEPGHVFLSRDCAGLFGQLRGGRIVVAPETPAERRLTATPENHRTLLRLERERPHLDGGCHGHTGALLHRSSWPVHGVLAQSLALGAHIAVHNGLPWNELGDCWHGYEEDRELLRESWGVHSPEGWRKAVDDLLDRHGGDRATEVALVARLRAVACGSRPRDVDVWDEQLGLVCLEAGLPPEALDQLRARARRVARYEARFRADGLLPADGFVTSVRGYDYGRAVNMARWGLAARYTDRAAAEEAVLRAGRMARNRYTSWAAFSAGYVLGRVLRFDDEEFGEWYRHGLGPHRVLTGDPASPWRSLDWRLPAR